MKLSTRAHYGLRAMVTIARYMRDGHVPVSVMDICRVEGISDTYLEQLISKLRHNGLLRSYRGAKGGYELTRPPEEITVMEVLKAAGEKIIFPDCSTDEGCRHAKSLGQPCPSAGFWCDLNDAVEKLGAKTLAQLLDEYDQRYCGSQAPKED